MYFRLKRDTQRWIEQPSSVFSDIFPQMNPHLSTTTISKRTNRDRLAILALQHLLGSLLRISIKDASNRIFLGTFVCTDKARNLVLANAEEYRLERVIVRRSKIGESEHGGGDLGGNGEEEGEEEMFERKGRYVGMVMIPWKYVLDVEEDTTTSLSKSLSSWTI
jgi:N-alpha-acetyltransferase 38, NatC auxiliary subunit